MNYCIQCEHIKETDEQNLYICGIVGHNVCGNTPECKDFKQKNLKYVKAFEGARRMQPHMVAGMLVNQMKKLDKARELLTKIEWKYDSDYDVFRCPDCENTKEQGHIENCDLKELIK